MHTGTTYFIITTNIFFDLNFPELSTSSEMNLGFTINPIKTAVINATTGIMMLLLIKSKKSRIE